MIQKPTKQKFSSNILTVVEAPKSTAKNDIEEMIEYWSDIENYSKEEFIEGVEAHKWYLETLLNIGSHEEIKDFMANYAEISYSFLVEKAIEQLESNLKLKLDNICNILEYQTLEHDYQLDNTFRLFNDEQAIAIGDYENYLIIASEKYCHLIDTKKTSLERIHKLFINGKVNVFYKATQTLQLIKDKKILMTNNIFDVTSAYKLLFGEAITEEEIEERIDEQLGNLSDKDKAIKKTQYLLKVRLELRQQIIDKKLIKEAKELFESVADPFTVHPSSLEFRKHFDKSGGGEPIKRIKYNEKKETYEYTGKLTDKFISFKDEYEIVHVEKIIPVLS
jgi:hypothetical protein